MQIAWLIDYYITDFFVPLNVRFYSHFQFYLINVFPTFFRFLVTFNFKCGQKEYRSEDWLSHVAHLGHRIKCHFFEGMEIFCRSKKNMVLSIRKGISDALIKTLEYFLGMKVAKDREKETEMRRANRRVNLVSDGCQAAPKIVLSGSGLESQPWVRRRLQQQKQKRRSRETPKKKRSGWRVRSGWTSENQSLNWRLRNRRGQGVPSQKWC